MNLTNITTVKGLLNKYNFTFSKSKGQNFLINGSVCPKMAAHAVTSKDICVLEIGPGIGTLTAELCRLARSVVTIEIDRRLEPILEETLAEYDNKKIIYGDCLKLDLHKIISENFAGAEVVVCANLPYYITSPIIMKLLEEKLPISSITVLIQKEVATRYCAPMPSREVGAVTVAMQYYCKPKKLFNVSAGSFMPAPKVDSTVLQLEVYKQPPTIVNNENIFFMVVKSAFAQRRKTLLNSLSSGAYASKEQILFALNTANVPPTARAEDLTLKQFADIANNIL